MHDSLERRKYKRIEKPFKARFRTIIAQRIVSADWGMVTVKNLSEGGMLFDYKKNLGINTHLDLKIDISKSTPLINCVGKIIRIDEHLNSSMFGIATSFTDISKQGKEIINKTANEIPR
ncbi:MAG: PilZ domain-containing protein [Candidatus Scalinduaceae bacterium]